MCVGSKINKFRCHSYKSNYIFNEKIHIYMFINILPYTLNQLSKHTTTYNHFNIYILEFYYSFMILKILPSIQTQKLCVRIESYGIVFSTPFSIAHHLLKYLLKFNTIKNIKLFVVLVSFFFYLTHCL